MSSLSQRGVGWLRALVLGVLDDDLIRQCFEHFDDFEEAEQSGIKGEGRTCDLRNSPVCAVYFYGVRTKNAVIEGLGLVFLEIGCSWNPGLGN